MLRCRQTCAFWANVMLSQVGVQECFLGEKMKLRDVLDRTTSEIASGSKPGMDATKRISGESFARA